MELIVSRIITSCVWKENLNGRYKLWNRKSRCMFRLKRIGHPSAGMTNRLFTWGLAKLRMEKISHQRLFFSIFLKRLVSRGHQIMAMPLSVNTTLKMTNGTTGPFCHFQCCGKEVTPLCTLRGC